MEETTITTNNNTTATKTIESQLPLAGSHDIKDPCTQGSAQPSAKAERQAGSPACSLARCAVAGRNYTRRKHTTHAPEMGEVLLDVF